MNRNISVIRKDTMDIEQYSQTSPQLYSTIVPELLAKYLNNKKSKIVLDCGCGDGSLLFALKAQDYFAGREINAIDLSQNRIQLVKKISPLIDARVDNVETLATLKDKSLDFLFSTQVIEHVDDDKMLAALSRVLRDNGICYINTVFKKPYGWFYYRNQGHWVLGPTHLREYSNDRSLFSLLEKHNFEILESKKTLIAYSITDFFVKRFTQNNRLVYERHPFLEKLSHLKLPILGYYIWEIVARKQKTSA